MFCSSCGGAVAKGLSYCNHCGAKLNAGRGNKSEVQPDWLIFSMMATFIFGLAGITILMGVMKVIVGLPVEHVLALALIPFLVLLLLEAVFIRLLFRRSREVSAAGDDKLTNQHATNELNVPQARALPEGVSSVTEQTTRAFDPIYTERKQ